MTSVRRAEILFGGGLLGFVLIAALLGEALLQLRQSLRFDWADLGDSIMYTDETHDFMRFTPGSTYGTIEINSLGLPGPEVALPKPEGTIRLAFLGDSTFLAANLTEEDRVPYQVAALVDAAFPACTVDWLNISGPSYAYHETTVILSDIQARAAPDAYVVMLSGLTEAVEMVEARENPERSYFSSPGRVAGASLLLTNFQRAFEALRKAQGDERNDLLERLDLQIFEDVFAANLASLAALIGPAPTVMIENRGRERDTMTPDALALLRRTLLSAFDGLSGEGLITLRTSMRDAQGALAAQNGWAYIDPLSDLAPTNEFFDGTVHFTAGGIRAVAPDIAEAVVAQITASDLGARCLAAGPAGQETLK